MQVQFDDFDGSAGETLAEFAEKGFVCCRISEGAAVDVDTADALAAG